MSGTRVRIACGSVIAAFLMVVLLATSATPSDSNGIRRVVVIHLDTTRQDDFSCYGGIPRTPNIDAVAGAGMRFTNSIAPVPKTSPSIASFMTGRLANRHGIYDVGGRLLDRFVTLAEILRDNGFTTGGFTSNPSVDVLKSDPEKTAGFDQGFDVYRGILEWPDFPEGVERNAVPRAFGAPLTDGAMDFVDEHADEKFFLWMLYLDPHATYAPPEPFNSMYLKHPELVANTVELPVDRIHRQAFVSTRRFSHEYIARHMGEVTMVDHMLGPLLAKVNSLPGRTLIVITADHGESLGDQDYWFGHGNNIRYPCVNVPLIITCEGLVPQGTSHALVANVDIAPTILNLLGLSAEPLDGDGRSLVTTFTESDPWPQRLIPIQSYRGGVWRGVRSATYSLQSAFFLDTGKFVGHLLFDLVSDPKESINVVDHRPAIMDALVAFENDWFTRDAAEEHHLRDNPEMIERLRSLGYLK